jgi:hypothetical protein
LFNSRVISRYVQAFFSGIFCDCEFGRVDFSMVTSAENEPFEMSDGKMAAPNG